MKISIVYFSSTGRTAKMAEEIKKGIAAASADIEVGLFPITELTAYNEENITFVNDSAAVIVGTPDYYASEANQLKTWLDTCPCKLLRRLQGSALYPPGPRVPEGSGGGRGRAVPDLRHPLCRQGPGALCLIIRFPGRAANCCPAFSYPQELTSGDKSVTMAQEQEGFL